MKMTMHLFVDDFELKALSSVFVFKENFARFGKGSPLGEEQHMKW